MPDRGEVDALTHHEVLHRGDHRGLLVVTALLEAGDDLLLGGAVGHLALELVAREPGEDEVGGAAEDLRAERHQADAGHGEHRHADRLVLLRCHPADQATRIGLEVVGLLADHAAAERTATGTRPCLDAFGLLELTASGGRGSLDRLGHAASSALSWEATI